MAEAPRDQNHVPTALFESSTSPGTVIPGKIDELTGRILTDAAGITPGGSDGDVQFNDNGVLGGNSGFIYDKNNNFIKLGGATPTYTVDSHAAVYATKNIAGYYVGISVQNINSGTTSSTDVVAMSDNGSDTSNYIDLGINSSTNSDPLYTIMGAGTGYLYNQSGDLTIGTATAGKIIKFFTGGTLAANERVRITDAGLTVGLVGGTTGALLLKGTTSGVVTIKTADAAGTWSLTLPTTAGSSGQVLSTDGNGVTSWVSASGVPTTITVANEATDTSCFIGFFTAATGDLGPKTNVNLTFNSNTGVLTAGQTISGSISGNAATATALQNARTIGGVSFNGTANITVASATGGFTVSGGNLTTSAIDIATDTTTGTKFGTATNQKIGFYNSTPVVQQTGDVATALSTLGLVGTPTVSATTIATATEATDTTCFPVFVTASGTQNLAAKTNTTLTYNSNTNDLGVTKLNGLTMSASTGTFTLTNAKTLAVTNSLTLSGTDSTTMTFPTTTATIARTDAAQTFTGVQTTTQVLSTNNAITASGNAATVPVTSKVNTVTNNSAATLTITMATASAIDRQTCIVCILDASAAAQTITWVNTENSTVSAPTTSNGSTTLPLTVGFMYNNATSKWRCIASA